MQASFAARLSRFRVCSWERLWYLCLDLVTLLASGAAFTSCLCMCESGVFWTTYMSSTCFSLISTSRADSVSAISEPPPPPFSLTCSGWAKRYLYIDVYFCVKNSSHSQLSHTRILSISSSDCCGAQGSSVVITRRFDTLSVDRKFFSNRIAVLVCRKSRLSTRRLYVVSRIPYLASNCCWRIKSKDTDLAKHNDDGWSWRVWVWIHKGNYRRLKYVFLAVCDVFISVWWILGKPSSFQLTIVSSIVNAKIFARHTTTHSECRKTRQ